MGEPLSIKWATINAPPFFIYSGELAHEGICDLLINELIDKMPDVEHTLLPLPNLRLKRQMQQGEKICLPCMIHQRQKSGLALHSTPSIVYLPHVLIMKSQTREKFVKEFGDPISLESLLESNKYLIGQHSGRKFGETIQPIFDRHLKRGLEVPNDVGSITSLLMLVNLDRVDFTIDYPTTLSYYNHSNSKPLSWLGIEENNENIVMGSVGCANAAPDQFAQRAIERINKVLPEILQSAHYQQKVEMWFKDLDPNYLEKYRKHLLPSPK